MKYLSLQTLEDVSSALNFNGDGIRVVGGCDLYTTKAAGQDKKLWKQIDHSLESQHESLLRLLASLSPRDATHFAKQSNLSQASPFGTLSRPSSRRKYAYMISTLNASHPDYDFSHVLRPSDFCREKRLRDVMQNVDSKLYGARSSTGPRGAMTPGGSILWGPRMWSMMDGEMDLFDCEIYSYKPEENPFDDEELALWSLHYFFFNKEKKRVCYLNLRALSPTWNGSDEEDDVEDGTITPIRPKRTYSSRQSVDFSARKRARFWFGDKAEDVEDEWENSHAIDDAESDDVDVELVDEIVKRARSMSTNSEVTEEDYEDEEVERSPKRKQKSNGKVPAMSQTIATVVKV